MQPRTGCDIISTCRAGIFGPAWIVIEASAMLP
jgi:hypothetical protein